MRIFKTVICALLALFALTILCFAGSFLFRAIPTGETEPPVVLNTENIFLEEEALVIPEEEPAEEEPAAEEEEPPVEEVPEPTPA